MTAFSYARTAWRIRAALAAVAGDISSHLPFLWLAEDAGVRHFAARGSNDPACLIGPWIALPPPPGLHRAQLRAEQLYGAFVADFRYEIWEG